MKVIIVQNNAIASVFRTQLQVRVQQTPNAQSTATCFGDCLSFEVDKLHKQENPENELQDHLEP